MPAPHRFAPADLERVEETVRRLGKDVTIALAPTTKSLGGEVWRIACGVGSEAGFGEGYNLAEAVADLGTSASEAA